MKISKLITPILTASLVVTSASLVLASCNNEDGPVVPEPQKDYIHDRSFSLMASAICQSLTDKDKYIYGREIYGTGWIIDDTTPNITNDYCYNLATNWHVTRGFDTLEGYAPAGYRYIDTWYFFADSSSTTRSDGIIDIYDYIWFGENNYVQCDSPVSNYLFSETSTDDYDGIDFHVCNVDFAYALAEEGAPKAIKTKLDKLNAFRKKNHYINKFVYSDDPEIRRKKKYIGGYPMKETPDKLVGGGRWEAHPIDSSLLSYCDRWDDNEGHYIDSDHFLTFKYYDWSAQYTTNKNFGTDWMSGGASGSILITEDFEVCGIYWGGTVDDGQHPTWFHPRFSLLKTHSYDFISQWTYN